MDKTFTEWKNAISLAYNRYPEAQKELFDLVCSVVIKKGLKCDMKNLPSKFDLPISKINELVHSLLQKNEFIYT